MNIYIYYNKKVGFFMPPFCKNDTPEQVATDQYRAIAMNLKKAKEQHFEELQVFHVGEFDDIKGEFLIYDGKKCILDCQEVMYKLQEAENSKNEG